MCRTVQLPLVFGSCQPRKMSCAIYSEFIKGKILLSALLLSCYPSRQNPRDNINSSIPFIYLFLSFFFAPPPPPSSSPLLSPFFFFPCPTPSFSLLLRSTWKTDYPGRSGVTVLENESYLLVENFMHMNQKFSYPSSGQSCTSLESVRHFPGGIEVAWLCTIFWVGKRYKQNSHD